MKRKGEAYATHNGGRIRKLANGSFQADFNAHGERKRKSFDSVAEAKTAIDAWKVAAKAQGRASFDITDRDLADVREARQWLGDTRLHAVFQFWKEHNRPVDAKTVEDLVDDFLDAPGRRGGRAVQRRDRTADNHRNRLALFTAAYGKEQAGQITAEHVVSWLDAHGWHGLNRRNYIGSVRALFAFAVRKGYALTNPTEHIELPEMPEANPVIMTPTDVDAYLAAVEKERPEILAREALAFFCGLRSTELARLDWQNISVENKLVTITGDVAKIQGHRRNVELPENLLAWIGPYAKASGRVSPAGEPYKARAVAAKAACVELPPNGGRHAFASYHLAMHQNAPLTAEALGHDDVKLLRNCYRNITASDGRPITKATAEAYFQIKPNRPLHVAKLVKTA